MQTAKRVPDAGPEGEAARKSCQLAPSALGRVSNEIAVPDGLSYPPETTFCPASQVVAKSCCAFAASDQGCVFTVTTGARRGASAATCAAVLPPSFFALSATSARFASGTTFAATAV